MDKYICNSTMPSWGMTCDTPVGRLQYYVDEPHDDAHVLERQTFVINLNHDVVDIAINSDKYFRMQNEKNSVVQAPSGFTIKERSDGSSNAVMVDFESNGFEQLKSSLKVCSSLTSNFRDDITDIRITKCANVIRSAFLSGLHIDRILMESLTAQLQLELINGLTKRDHLSKLSKLSPSQANCILEYMNHHYAEDISLNELACLLDLSVYHFSRLFKNSTGETPHRTLIELRLRKAINALTKSQDSIVNIALKTGFSSQAHMSESFRRLLNVTANQVRLAARM